MKTEQEIRQHLEDLKTCLRMPCNCAQPGHAISCHVGGKMISACAETLSWILGEKPAFQATVDRMHKDAAQFRAEQN